VAVSDGFPTLAELRRRRPELRAVIFNASAGPWAPGAARSSGATAFAYNPSSDGIGLSEEWVRGELLPAIRRLGLHPAPPATAPPDPEARRVAPAAIVIAVSTGGPDALEAVVGGLPAQLPVPVLVVQHMPADFTRMLAERLDRRAELQVVEAQDGDEVLAGRIYIAPGGRHMALASADGRVVVALHDGPRENSCRPAADVLFRAAADVYRAGVIAVVLTGMGEDGLRGAEAVHVAGGLVIAQSESTSVIASMPRAVAAAGLADAIVPLDELAAVLSAHALGSR
jgi:two-component system chemotaxis response regulator CheB